MKNSSRHWVLALVITLWTFRSPSRLQLPTWEFTFLHSRGHENVTPGLSLGPHPCKPFALVMSPRPGLRQPCYSTPSSLFLLSVSSSSLSSLSKFESASMWICFPYCEDSKAWILQSWSQIIYFANTTQFTRWFFFSQTKHGASALFMKRMLGP